jgi:DNA-binding protein
MSEEHNSVLIGREPVMNYVLAVITRFGGGADEVNIKARGRAISRAVDVVEVMRRQLMPEVKVKNVDIRTEQLASSVDARKVARELEKLAISSGIIDKPLNSREMKSITSEVKSISSKIVNTSIERLKVLIPKRDLGHIEEMKGIPRLNVSSIEITLKK